MFVISPPLEAPKAKYHFVLQRVVQPETDAIGWARYWHIATQTSRTLFWMHHSVYILQKSTFKWPTVIVSDHLADTGECVLHTHTQQQQQKHTQSAIRNEHFYCRALLQWGTLLLAQCVIKPDGWVASAIKHCHQHWHTQMQSIGFLPLCVIEIIEHRLLTVVWPHRASN